MRTFIFTILLFCSFAATAQTDLVFNPFFGKTTISYVLQDDYNYYHFSYTKVDNTIVENSAILDFSGKTVSRYSRKVEYDNNEHANFIFSGKKEIAKDLFE